MKKGRIVGVLLLLSAVIILSMPRNARTQSRSKVSKASASGEATQKTTSGPLRLSPAANQWVETTLKKMTVDEKIGQLLITTYHGSFTPTDSEAYQQMMRDVRELHVGGFIVVTTGSPLGIVKSQAYPTAVLANQLQAKSKLPLLIGADFERGTAMRLDEGTSFPTAMALAAADNAEEDAYLMGKVTALEARAVGVHWIYAPVADVNNNPGNPIINTRSFGEDPDKVSDYVTAFIHGVQENGGLATAKHFPGHGDTASDSHIDLPVVTASRQRLEDLELIPFRAAIAAGVGSIMTAHLSVPALEPDPDTPATLSRHILIDLLRKELRFQGLIITDALDMGGVTVRYAPGDAAVRAFLAGSDVLLMPTVPDAAFDALRDAVKSGRISHERLDESVRRILQAKARLGLNKDRMVDIGVINHKLGTATRQEEAQDISDRGVTLLRNSAQRLPLDGNKSSRALLVTLYADPEPSPGEDIERELRSRFDSVVAVRADTQFVSASTIKLPPPDSYDVAILALFVRVSDRKGNVDLPAEQIAVANRLFQAGKPVITIGFGSPYLIERFPNADPWLSVFGISEVAQISAARALFAEIPIAGKLPVTVPGAKLQAGFGLQLPAHAMTAQPLDLRAEARLQPAYNVVERAITDKAFPGATLAIGYRGKVALQAFGKLSYDPKSAAVVPNTIYDAASLTKVVVTTTLTAKLAEGDFPVTLDLDTPIVRYLPEWAAGPQPDWRRKVTVRHLLTHTSGLPAVKEYWRTSKSKEDTVAAICREPLENEPGKKEVYSDLGFILLGEIIERLTGQSLDALAREYIFAPLKMHDSAFHPAKKLWPLIAPTEFDANYRKKLLQGQIHDENSFAIGGVSGHAGLFSTAPDLASFCQMLLNGGVYGHSRILQRATIAQFTAAQDLTHKTRTFGWTLPTENSSSGHYFTAHSYGHTGFTGTSIWIDPERQVFVVFLTNRVNPTRENQKIAQIRPLLHDAVMQALGFAMESDASSAH